MIAQAVAWMVLAFAPGVRTVGPVVFITPGPTAATSFLLIQDDLEGHLWITIDNAVFVVDGDWWSSVLYVDGGGALAGTVVNVVNDTWVPLFVSGGAGAIDVACGFAGNTIYCGHGDTVVHGRGANLAFVVGHPKAKTVTFWVEQASASVVLEYVNDSRTRYKIVGTPTAKWER